MADAIGEIVGREIRAARDREGLTQAQLAKATGLSNNTIGRFELGHRDPKIQQLVRIANALGRSGSALLPAFLRHKADAS